MEYTKHIRGLYDFENFEIIGGNDINCDFYNMMKVSNLIVSMSSFVQQAAVLNMGNVIFPSHGPWQEMKKELLSGNIWTPDKQIYLDVDHPQKIYITSDEYYSWRVDHIIKILVDN